jgi:outer membrane protein OmpA-like peptidoglycan-associated protein
MESRVYYGEYSLKHWVNLLLKRNIVLPDYQRSFVWDEKDIKRLIKSLAEGQFVQPITIANYNCEEREQNLLLDGQQRLTSILLSYIGYIPDKDKFSSVDELASSDDSDEGDEHTTKIIGWTFEEMLEDNVSNITPVRIRCPSDAHGTYYPDCTCKDSNKVYNANMNRCDACPYDHIVVDGLCQCPQNTIESNGSCVESPRMSTVLRKVADDVMQKLSDEPAVLSADNLFEHGSAILTNDAKAALTVFIGQLRAAGATVCKPVVKGYADPSGGEDVNKRLSKNRAESVAEYLRKNSDKLINDVVTEYYGEDFCTCGLRNKVPAEQIDYTKNDYKVCKDQEDDYSVSDNNQSSRYAPCRRVEITHGCESGGGDLGGAIGSGLESAASTLTGPQ